mmetsp:Transcript_25446/g.56265  ORF Transcript_25446/g.56265 Transcript_25446/m.56265 type:complete len:180 (-) Transcript_25446:403-942(-)
MELKLQAVRSQAQNEAMSDILRRSSSRNACMYRTVTDSGTASGTHVHVLDVDLVVLVPVLVLVTLVVVKGDLPVNRVFGIELLLEFCMDRDRYRATFEQSLGIHRNVRPRTWRKLPQRFTPYALEKFLAGKNDETSVQRADTAYVLKARVRKQVGDLGMTQSRLAEVYIVDGAAAALHV